MGKKLFLFLFIVIIVLISIPAFSQSITSNDICAVLDLEEAKLPPDYEGFGVIIADEIVEFLVTKGYRVVERSALEKILKEQKLSIKGLTSEEAVKVGQLAGATKILIGRIIYISGKINVSIKVVDTSTSMIISAKNIYFDPDQETPKVIAQKLMAGILGIEPTSTTPVEKKKEIVKEETPTAPVEEKEITTETSQKNLLKRYLARPQRLGLSLGLGFSSDMFGIVIVDPLKFISMEIGILTYSGVSITFVTLPPRDLYLKAIRASLNELGTIDWRVAREYVLRRMTFYPYFELGWEFVGIDIGELGLMEGSWSAGLPKVGIGVITYLGDLFYIKAGFQLFSAFTLGINLYL